MSDANDTAADDSFLKSAPWGEIAKLGIMGITAIFEYWAASAERKAALRGKADADATRAMDLIDGIPARNNAIMDAAADQKFGPVGNPIGAAQGVQGDGTEG